MGFISAFPDTAELARVALEEGVAAINHSFADPTPFVAPTHAAGATVFVQVQTLTQAITAARAGAERADLAVAGVSAGVAAGLIRSARPAGESVRGIVQEAEDLLRERPRRLLG